MPIDKIYNIERIWEQLKNGASLLTLANFYGVEESELKSAIKKHYGWKDSDDISKILNNARKGNRISKVKTKTLITRAKEEQRKGTTWEKFERMIKESGRDYSLEDTKLAKEIFSRNKIENNIEDEIEM